MNKETYGKYHGWIRALADYQGGRPHFADQTPESLYVLKQLVGVHRPTVIIELGTVYGLSTRLWLEEAPTATIHCIDAGFGPLRGTKAALPYNEHGLTLHESWVHDVRLQDLWAEDDKVLLYVDVHSDHLHVFDAVPDLPSRSIVVFDDVWRCGKRLESQEEIDAFVEETVKPQIDYTAPKAIWPLRYAHYWKRGGFYGFDGVPIICNWVEQNRVSLHWEKGAKLVWFQWPQDKE